MINLYFKKNDIPVEDKELNRQLDYLQACYKFGQIQNLNFIYTVYEFKNQRTELGFSDVLLKNKQVVTKATLLSRMFGISQGTFSKMCRVCERFVHLKTTPDRPLPFPVWNDFLEKFNTSKIFELLPLTDEQVKFAILNGQIDYQMTLLAVRRAVKSILKGEQEVEEPKDTIPSEDDEVPDTVKVNKERFTAKDLKKFKKDELIKMYLDLQMAYIKIKEKK